MPLSTNPDDLIPFRLKLDEQANSPATFLLRFLSCRQMLKVRQLLTTASAESDGEKGNDLLNQVIAIGVGGWRGLPVEYDPKTPDMLDDVLTPAEKAELAFAIVEKPRLTEHERKNSGSRPSLPTGSSAGTAPAASVATSPQTQTGTGSTAPNAAATDANPATAPASSC